MYNNSIVSQVKRLQTIQRSLSQAQESLSRATHVATLDNTNLELISRLDANIQCIQQLNTKIDNQRCELVTKLEKQVGAVEVYRLLE